MAYTKNIWTDGANGGTPITAARLTNMENGIAAAQVFSDTGWIDMTPGVANGYGVGTDGAHYRVVNGICYFQIHCGTSTAAAGATFYSLPTTARPLWNHWYMGEYANAFKGEFKVFATGVMSFGVASTPFVTAGSFPVG